MSSSILSSSHQSSSLLAPTSSSSLGHAPSNNSHSQGNSQTQLPQPQTTSPKQRPVPSNLVTLQDGTTVRVRIEETLAVDDVVRQLCISVKIKDPSAMYALRDENDELVTNENLRKKVKSKVPLKLVYSTPIEAAEIIEKLVARDNRLGRTLTDLRKLIRVREDQFAIEFLNRDGLSELIDIINKYQGNILAYALTALQNLMELDHGWSDIDDAFIFRVVQILSSENSLINVCRPATAILKKLVEADPMAAPGPTTASSSKDLPQSPPGSVYKFGFECVFEQMRKEKTLLETVVNRLGSADTTMALYSMMLINSLLAHATDARWEEFIGELQRLNVRKAVIRLMSSHTIEDLTSCILDFQANMVRVTYRRKTTIVEQNIEPEHAAALNYIWINSKVKEEYDPDGGMIKWRLLGCQTEDLAQEFGEVGVLGLDCLKHFVAQDPDFFAKVVQEQLSRAPERRCPIITASNEVVDLLCEHWAIFGPGYSTSTTFQPFFLNFNRVHALATHFFLRMWNESGATRGDFPRVAALVRSQVKVALRKENVRAWHEVEADFTEVEYRAVRDRQMRELEKEDDVMSKVPVRNMRAKLYKESFEFVRQQRIHCLMQGAWFMNAMPLASNASRDTIRKPSRPWRFMRLDNSMRYLHFVDSALKFDIRNGLEDLKERIDLSSISEIATGTCAPYPQITRNDQPENLVGPGSPSLPSQLSFSLLTASGSSLADQIAPDQSRWADWVDGLNMLRSGGHVASNETDMFVQALTEIGLKIRLLNLSGDKAEIPSGIQSGHPPTNSDFFFSDLVYDTQG
ncbi:ELMO/CED-12 family-domain-containing protein [Cytidiella melzeri]|nr:ELMO/CED-12 family-domain-containing protein [Cytidiella melzeri]